HRRLALHSGVELDAVRSPEIVVDNRAGARDLEGGNGQRRGVDVGLLAGVYHRQSASQRDVESRAEIKRVGRAETAAEVEHPGRRETNRVVTGSEGRERHTLIRDQDAD